jgi:hypothetical protein
MSLLNTFVKNGFAVVQEGSRRPVTVSRHRKLARAEETFDELATKYRQEHGSKQHPFQLRKLVGGLLKDEL